MVGKQPGGESGERLTRLPDSRAAASGSSSVLAGNEHFSIARRSHPAQLLLVGELDICSASGLTVALSDAADSTGVLHLDLAALRAIISPTQASDHQQQRPPAALPATGGDADG
jgi:hypothetical protein